MRYSDRTTSTPDQVVRQVSRGTHQRGGLQNFGQRSMFSDPFDEASYNRPPSMGFGPEELLPPEEPLDWSPGSDEERALYKGIQDSLVRDTEHVALGDGSLGGLTDVTLGTLANNDLLAVNASGVWTNQNASEAGLAAASHNHGASDITSGTLALARGGTNTGLSGINSELIRMASDGSALEGSGSTVASFAAVSHEHAAGDITSGILTLARGGTNADLTLVAGGNFISRTNDGSALEDSGYSGSSFAAASHAHAATDITSGLLALVRGGSAADLSGGGINSEFIRMNSGGTAFEGSGSTAATFAAASHEHAAGDVTSGQLALARGGSAADLSGGGINSELVRMASDGLALEGSGSTVASFAAASHEHAASDVTSGLLALARGGTNAALAGINGELIQMKSDGTVLEGSGSSTSDFAAAAHVHAAADITSGLLALARGGTNAALAGINGELIQMKSDGTVLEGSGVAVAALAPLDDPTFTTGITTPRVVWTSGPTVSVAGTTMTIDPNSASTWLLDLANSGAGNMNFRLDGDIVDANGNELLEFSETASAVNHLQIINAATGGRPILEAVGGDTNIDLNLKCKGTGTFLFHRTNTSGNMEIEGVNDDRVIFIGKTFSNTATDSAMFRGFRARGTAASPTAVADDDRIFLISVGARAVDTSTQYPAQIEFKIDTAPSGDNVPTEMLFTTGQDSVNRDEALTADSSQNVTIPNGTFTVSGGATSLTGGSLDVTGSVRATTYVDAASYVDAATEFRNNGTAGLSTTVTDGAWTTMTFSGGILTAVT